MILMDKAALSVQLSGSQIVDQEVPSVGHDPIFGGSPKGGGKRSEVPTLSALT